jgi:hypothetical protein
LAVRAALRRQPVVLAAAKPILRRGFLTASTAVRRAAQTLGSKQSWKSLAARG